MRVMAPTRPTQLHGRRIRLPARPATAAEARSQVRAAICAWDLPVDPDAAVLLTSELVTNAIMREAGASITVDISCSVDHLRVEVHDSSPSLPVLADPPGGAETGRGLVLVASLAADWGVYRTPDGKAVYFTLGFHRELAGGADGHLDGARPWRL
jgi:anti-sigma regulatory factor (Ser/Thr protein kinase)